VLPYPEIIVKNVEKFAAVFHTPEQQKHFCEYVTGLIAGDKATVTAINELYLNKNDQSSLNKFLTQAKWDEDELNRRRISYELERMQRRPVSAKAGRLILDDTMAHHTQCSIPGLAYLYDHTVGHRVWAHNLITSYYVNRSDQFPVDFRLYLQFKKAYETKQLAKAGQQWAQQLENKSLWQTYISQLISYHYRQQAYQPKAELGADLVKQAIQLNLPFDVVLFDSWYLRWNLILPLTNMKKDWIGGCPKNRKVMVNGRWLQLQEYIKTIPAIAYRPYQIGTHLYWAFTKVVAMNALKKQRVRIVATYEDAVDLRKLPSFYASNRKDWEPKRILTTYGDRWPTETFNEDAKGNLGFEDYQLRRWQGIKRHWYLCFVAYSLLGDQGPPGRSRWAVPGQFKSTGQRCREVADELLNHLVHWLARQLNQGNSPDELVKMLVA
jgi:SRSO17 transposase